MAKPVYHMWDEPDREYRGRYRGKVLGPYGDMGPFTSKTARDLAMQKSGKDYRPYYKAQTSSLNGETIDEVNELHRLLIEEADNHPDPLYGESLKRCVQENVRLMWASAHANTIKKSYYAAPIAKVEPVKPAKVELEDDVVEFW